MANYVLLGCMGYFKEALTQVMHTHVPKSKIIQLIAHQEYDYALSLIHSDQSLLNQDTELRQLWLQCHLSKAKHRSSIKKLILWPLIGPIYLCALICFYAESYAWADRFLLFVFAKNPLFAPTLSLLAASAFAQKHFPLAILYHEQNLSLRPTHIASLKQLARLYIQQSSIEQAEHIYQKLEQIAPQDYEVQKGLKNLSALKSIQHVQRTHGQDHPSV